MKAVYVVHSRPSDPARDGEFNDWYDNTHLPEVCAIPGVVGAQRYRLMEPPEGAGSDPSAHEYLALYHIDAEDPAKCVAEIGTRVGDGRIKMTDAIQLDPLPLTVLYGEL